MELRSPFTESTLERLPEPTSDPAIALARAAHLLLEIAHHPQITPKVSPWVIKIVRAHMEHLDPTWSSKLSTLARQSMMSLMGITRFQGELNALTEAGFHGYGSLLGQSFAQLADLNELILRVSGRSPAAVLAAIAAHTSLPDALHQERAILLRYVSQLSDTPPSDARVCTYIAETGVLGDLWIRVDTAARRLLLRPQDIHRWIREGSLEARMEDTARRINIGALCSLTGAKWLLPSHVDGESKEMSLPSHPGGSLLMMRGTPPPLIEPAQPVGRIPVPTGHSANDVIGYAIWTSPEQAADAQVQFWIKSWGQMEAGGDVAVEPVLDEILKDPAGKPIMHRNLSLVTRRPS